MADPIFLDLDALRAEIERINAQIEDANPELDPDDKNDELALDAIKRRAYGEFVALAKASSGLSFRPEDLADVLSISTDDVQSTYYDIDLTDLYGTERILAPAGGTLTLSDDITAALEAAAPSRTFGIPTAVTAEDVRVASDFPLQSQAGLQSLYNQFVPPERQVTGVTQDTPAFTTQSTLPSTLFDAINFPAPPITRGVPVVTRGLDAAGQPTTAITMGQATATPSGPNIGQLDITTQFPSTGMGINPDGTGTTTVGTPGTTGTIVASGADTIDVFGDGADASPISQNVIGTQGNQVTTNLVGTTSTPSPQQQTEAQIRAAEIQRLFKESPTKDIAAQRIGDYAMSKGGITAEEIAAAVNPLLTGAMASPTTFGITPDLDAPEILEAVEDFRYGTGPAGGEFITAGAVTAPTPTFPTLSQQQQRIRDLNEQAAAVGEGPYTEQEAAFRILDFARNNNLSLADAAASFGMDEAAAKQTADRLGINLGNFGFAKGGEVNDARTNAVNTRLMAQSGLASMRDKMMMPCLNDTISRIMDRKE